MRKEETKFNFTEQHRIGGYRTAVETFRTESGGYDVAAYYHDDQLNEWTAVGDAEKVNNFASEDEARQRGMEILHEELILCPALG